MSQVSRYPTEGAAQFLRQTAERISLIGWAGMAEMVKAEPSEHMSLTERIPCPRSDWDELEELAKYRDLPVEKLIADILFAWLRERRKTEVLPRTT